MVSIGFAARWMISVISCLRITSASENGRSTSPWSSSTLAMSTPQLSDLVLAAKELVGRQPDDLGEHAHLARLVPCGLAGPVRGRPLVFKRPDRHRPDDRVELQAFQRPAHRLGLDRLRPFHGP